MIFPSEDIHVDAPRATPLYAAAASASEANLWTSVNGWSTPRIFTSVDEEYKAAKSGAAMADLGPLARYAVRGADAALFLARVTTAPAARLNIGESARGLILDNEGVVVDLAEVSRLSDGLYLLVTPLAHPRRLQLGARGLDAIAEHIGDDVAALGVFGPSAAEALAAAGLKTPHDHIAASAMVRGVETATRPIQFGAPAGLELIYPKAEALTVWERLQRRAGLAPIGLDALEVLRIEAGVPRPGVDFAAAEEGAPQESLRTPGELGLAHLAPMDRGWFNGRRGLRHLAPAPARPLIAIAIDDERAMPGAAVFCGDKTVGRITSCAFSPAIKRVVAFADLFGPTNGKGYEVSVPAPADGRVGAKVLKTTESILAAAYWDAQGYKTQSRR
jgi:aminomethyltransferase